MTPHPGTAPGGGGARRRPAHRRRHAGPAATQGGTERQAAAQGGTERQAAAQGATERQAVWIVFGGAADQPWLRPLRRGFRHCFAALDDGAGWTVLDPLSGRLVVARLEVEAGFDLPGFYRRAGFAVLGPFAPGGPRRRLLPPVLPFTCVALCRAVLGAGAPFALTPYGLYRALRKISDNRKILLTPALSPA